MSNYGLPDYRQPSPLVEVPNETTGSDGSKLPPWSADERDRRLVLAEEILCDLATAYWTAILDDNDDPVSEKMGQRVLGYWQKNVEIADKGSGKEAKNET